MTNEQINELSQPFVELFTEMEDRLLLKIAEQLAYDGDLSDTSKWRIRQLARAGLLDKEALKIIREYTGIQSDMLDITLQTAALNELDYVDTAAQAAIAQSLIDDAVVPPAAETAQNAMRSFYRQALVDTNAVNTVMRYKAKQAYTSAVNNAYFSAQEVQRVHNALGAGTAAVVTGAESLQTAVRDTIKQLSEDGIPAFVDKAGREWSPEAYVRMDIRTTAANTARQAQFDRCEQYNIKLIQVDSHRGARPLCAPYQGRIYSLDGTSGTCEDGGGKKIDYVPLSSTSYGEPAGLFGINCMHSPHPFVPGINMRRYFPTENMEENSKEYKQFQKQRALERDIRKSKRECMMLDASGNSDSEEFKKASAKLKEKRKRYKEYCEETGLRQHNDRTQVYGFDKNVSAKASAANSNQKLLENKISSNPKRTDANANAGLTSKTNSVTIKSINSGSKLFTEENRIQMLQHERIISGNKYEKAIIYKPDGSIDFQKKGNSDSVSFSAKEIKSMDGKVLTHNHPNGTIPSPADINIMRRGKLAEIRACNTDGAYVIRRSGKWASELTSLKKIDNAYNSCIDEVLLKYQKIANENGENFFKYFDRAEKEGLQLFCDKYNLEFSWEDKNENKY